MARPLKGVLNIMATPFDDRGEVDEASLRRLVEFQLAKGAAGLNILGIMGEYHKLLDEERRRIVHTVVQQVAGRVPVVVGCSHQGTRAAIRLAQEAAAAGADAIMVAPPINAGNLDAVFDFYRQVAESVPVPVVVQDEPNFTKVNMPPAFLARICNEIPGCDYIKLEDAPTPVKISRVKPLLKREVGIFGGLGGVYFYEELNRGAIGTMTGFSFTEILVEVYRLFTAGDRERAREVFYRHVPLLRFEYQPVIGLAIRKLILQRRGAIAHAATRHPGPSVDEETVRELEQVLAYCGLSLTP